MADPDSTVVGISGDYVFQLLIEQLACGAQFRLPMGASIDAIQEFEDLAPAGPTR